MKFLKTIAPAALSELWEKVSGNIVPKDTSANVGIGTDDPGTTLEVSSATPVIRISDNNSTGTASSAYIEMGSDTGTWDAQSFMGMGSSTNSDIYLYNYEDAGIQFFTDSTFAAVIDNNGNVGIGTDSPSVGLEIEGGSNTAAKIGIINTNPSPDNSWSIHAQYNDQTLRILGDSTTVLQMVDTGAVIAPAQPAFLVQPSATQSNITTGSAVTVVFGTEIFDQGGDFASNTFTAPVSGRYQLNYAIELENVDTAATYYYIVLKTSNRDYNVNLTPGFSSDLSYYSMTYSVLADMDASDTAYVQLAQSGGTAQTDINANSKFSGFLAC